MAMASPATQWMVEPSPCFHSGVTKRSCVPGQGSLHESTYSTSPIGPRYPVTSTQPHFITLSSGLLRHASQATYATDTATNANQPSITISMAASGP